MKADHEQQPSLLPLLQETKPRRRSRPQRERDPLLDHAAVKLYREVCRSTPNYVQRQEIAQVVGDSARSLAIYRDVLTQFMNEGQPRYRADWTIERFGKAFMAELASSHTDSAFSPDEIRARLMSWSRALAEAAEARRRERGDDLCGLLSETASDLYEIQNRMVDNAIDLRWLEATLNRRNFELAAAVLAITSPGELEAAQAAARGHLKK